MIRAVLYYISVPPNIEGDQRSMEKIVLVGENVTLPCEVTGMPWPRISWKKDLRNIDFYDTSHKSVLMLCGESLLCSSYDYYACMQMCGNGF